MASNFHPFNKAHEGQFTRKAKAAGMGVQEFASHVIAHGDNFSTLTRRQAAGAKAAKVWAKNRKS